jgi:hypothetical protein
LDSNFVSLFDWIAQEWPSCLGSYGVAVGDDAGVTTTLSILPRRQLCTLAYIDTSAIAATITAIVMRADFGTLAGREFSGASGSFTA